MTQVLETKDAPTANGRTPQPNEIQWKLVFPLPGDNYLILIIGEKTHDQLVQFFIDEIAERPNYDDGSLPAEVTDYLKRNA